MSQTEWLVRVKLPLRPAVRIIEGLGNKAQQRELRCARFGWNWLAPTETCSMKFGGHPFRRRLRITHDATVRE